MSERQTVIPQEKRLGLIHRVLAARYGMKEYAVLVTEKRSIFIEQPKTTSSLRLRTEILSGAPPKTNIKPKTLEDYSTAAVGSLELEPQNINIFHESVTKLTVGIGGLFPVYHFDLEYNGEKRRESLVFYAIPLGSYTADGEQRPREVILRDYADSVFRLYQQVIPATLIENAGLGTPS